MGYFLWLPVAFLIFWYFEAPKGMLSYFGSLNTAFLSLFSFTLLLKTFFQPWKHEYRQGLVGFSRSMGMAIKACVIVVTLLFFAGLLLCEGLVLIGFLLLPMLTIGALFYA